MADAWTLFGSVEMDTGDADRKLSHLDGKVDDLGHSMGNAEKSGRGLIGNVLGKATGMVGSLGGAVTGLLGPVGMAGMGIGQMTSFLGDSVKAAREEKLDIDRLTNTLKANLPAWDGNSGAIDDYVGQMEKLSFSDDKVRDSLGKLVFRTHDLKLSQEAQMQAMNLARAKNIDLATATELVGKALDGQTSGLKKAGIEIEKGMDAHQMLAQIQKQTGDAAQDYANSSIGAQERVTNAWNNFQEDIGSMLMPVLDTVMTVVGGLTTGFMDLAQNGMGMVQGAMASLQPVVQPVVDWFTTLWGLFQKGDLQGIANQFGFLAEPIKIIGGYIGGVVSAFSTFFDDLGKGGDLVQSVGTLLGNLWTNFSTSASKLFDWVSTEGLPLLVTKLQQWGGAFLGFMQKDVLPFIGSKFDELGTAISSWFSNGGYDALVNNLTIWSSYVLDWIGRDVAPFIGQKLGELGTAIHDWFTGGGYDALADNLALWSKELLGWIGRDVLPFIGQKLGELGQAIWGWMSSPDGLGALVFQLGTWSKAFLTWIEKDVLPFIGGKLGEFGASIWNWLTSPNGGGAAVQKLGEWSKAFLDWVSDDVLPFIGGKLWELAIFIGKWIVDDALPGIVKAVHTWAVALWDWASQVWGDLSKNLGQVWTDISNWIGSTAKSIYTSALQMGKNLVDGLVQGIKDNWTLVAPAGFGLAAEAIDAVNKKMDAHSPSRVMYDAGINFVTGFANGISENWLLVTTAIGNGFLQVSPAEMLQRAQDGGKPLGAALAFGTSIGFEEEWATLASDMSFQASQAGQDAAKAYLDNLKNGVATGSVDTRIGGIDTYMGSYRGEHDPGGTKGTDHKYAATGFQGWVTSPTNFTVGENRPEYVSVIPGGKGMGGARIGSAAMSPERLSAASLMPAVNITVIAKFGNREVTPEEIEIIEEGLAARINGRRAGGMMGALAS
ncbi:MAG TPA: hypothetical protein VF914_21045 [Chloroflexia bacterium]|jgi:hypothetical protein